MLKVVIGVNLEGLPNRAIIFAHYDIQNVVDPYVYYYLRELIKISRKLVFVSTANIKKDQVDKLESLGCDVMLRENIGYDFMSYKFGLDSIDTTTYDEVVICNDSVYGPFFNLDHIFTEMSSQSCDFWGMTSNRDIAYHLQSYFIVFNRSVLNSNVFRDFWDSVGVLDSKKEIIRSYEVGLTKMLREAGFNALEFADYKPALSSQLITMSKRFSVSKILGKIISLIKCENILPQVNVTHFFWKELISQANMPFIKVELLRDNPMKENIDNYEEVIRSVSNYDSSLIKNHLLRVAAK